MMRLSQMILGVANVVDVVAGEAITKTAKAIGGGIGKATDAYIEHKDTVAINTMSEILEFIETNQESMTLSKRVSYVLELIQQNGIPVESAPKLFTHNRFSFYINENLLYIREEIMGSGFTGAVLVRDKDVTGKSILDASVMSIDEISEALKHPILQKAVARALIKEDIDHTISRFSIPSDKANLIRNNARSILGLKQVSLKIT